jgi:uncharacterized protein
MKISNYTFAFETAQNECYLYNSLSNALLLIDEDVYTNVKLYNNGYITKSNFDADLWKILIDKRFIVENDKDEFLLYKSIIMGIRQSNDSMHLTIAPTMDCNFRCYYCFETLKKRNYITDDIINSIIKLITKLKTLKHIHLTWFGGEPLMAIDKMKLFYEKFKPQWQQGFSSNIITTGYHIDRDVIEILKKIEVSVIQITFDGIKENHNRVKQDKNCNDVFSKTVENVELLTELAPDIQINVRVNLTKENQVDFVNLVHLFSIKFKNKKVGVFPAFVNDRGYSSNSYSEKPLSMLFSKKEQIKFLINLTTKFNIPTHFLSYPTQIFNECAVRNNNAVSIDPDGYVYKCWEVIGNEKYAVGKLDTDGNITNINITEQNRFLYGADPLSDKICSKCACLPMCHGGCPMHRLDNEFNNGKNDTCCYYKGHLAEILSLYTKYKQKSNN